MSPSRGQGARGEASEERIDARRYLDALRRSRWLVAGVVAVMTLTVGVVSLALPKNYSAAARIALEDTGSALGQTDAESTQRRLATTETLLTAPNVLSAAARKLPGETRDSLDDKVESSVDENANIINISVTDRDARDAAAIANAVAKAFLRERAQLDRARLRRARANLELEIARLRGTSNASVQVAAIRERISELTVSEGSAGSDLQLAEAAQVPGAASSPRPVRNIILALFGSLFLGVLIALGRDQLVPRVSSSRELGRLLDVPTLVGVPLVGRMGSRRMRALSGVEAEAYATLRSALELQVAERETPVILVTGALHAEGKTTATARLGRALAESGRRTLLVSADLRVPKLHDAFNLPLGVGLSDLLAVLDWDREDAQLDRDLLEKSINVTMQQGRGGKSRRGMLHVITSGTKARDPGRLISAGGMGHFMKAVRELDYDYILIDAPPLLGLPDSQVMARLVDEILLVSRLDRLSLDHVAELRDALDRLPIRPLGMVVIGARGEISPYYLQGRQTLIQEEAEAGGR